VLQKLLNLKTILIEIDTNAVGENNEAVRKM